MLLPCSCTAETRCATATALYDAAEAVWRATGDVQQYRLALRPLTAHRLGVPMRECERCRRELPERHFGMTGRHVKRHRRRVCESCRAREVGG